MSQSHSDNSLAPIAATDAAPPLGVTVVVPVYNEAECVAELSRRLAESLDGDGRSFEIVFVDDGSTDATFARVAAAREVDARVRGVRLRRNSGKSAALAVGFREARGELVVTIDGDLQDEPSCIPALLAPLDQGYDLVSGWKQQRQDRLSKRWSSKLYNFVTSQVSGLRLHDYNCGLKAYRSEVTASLEVYGELHRYLPALAHWSGFRVTEVPVAHHARRHGVTKFGRERYLNGLLDLVAVMFLHEKARSPIHLFGRLGLLSSLAGSLISLFFVVQWFGGAPMRVRPLMLCGAGLIILGVQFVSIGLLGELIARERGRETAPISERLE